MATSPPKIVLEWSLGGAVPMQSPHYHAILRSCAEGYGVTIPKPAQDPAWPLPNVWLGVSAEDQDAANARIPLLLRAPAAVRWVSAEPLIGPLDLWCIADGSWYDREGADFYNALTGTAFWGNGDHGLGGGPRLDWVVLGGESGHGARECRREWLQSAVRDCQRSTVPVFVKQLGAAYSDPEDGVAGPAVKDTGGYEPPRLTHPKGGDVSEWPEALRVRQWPKGYRV